MERKIEFSTDEYYHVYNRGADKRIIFTNNGDRDRFLKLLFLCNGTEAIRMNRTGRGFPSANEVNRGNRLVSIGAYTLMPNHFHLLLKELDEGGISRFMLKLTTAYSMYFNKKYEHSGVLFQGAFKAEHIDNDRYLEYIFSYIHLNIIKLIQPDWKERGILDINGAQKNLTTYPYSSYVDYLGSNRKEGAILNKEDFPEYHKTGEEMNADLLDWLSYSKDQ